MRCGKKCIFLLAFLAFLLRALPVFAAGAMPYTKGDITFVRGNKAGYAIPGDPVGFIRLSKTEKPGQIHIRNLSRHPVTVQITIADPAYTGSSPILLSRTLLETNGNQEITFPSDALYIANPNFTLGYDYEVELIAGSRRLQTWQVAGLNAMNAEQRRIYDRLAFLREVRRWQSAVMLLAELAPTNFLGDLATFALRDAYVKTAESGEVPAEELTTIITDEAKSQVRDLVTDAAIETAGDISVEAMAALRSEIASSIGRVSNVMQYVAGGLLYATAQNYLSPFAVFKVSMPDTLVVEGDYDNIEFALDSLGIQYKRINGFELADYDLTGIAQLYLNCGLEYTAGSKVKTFVESGGNLYASDLTYEFIEPWGLEFVASGVEGGTTAQITDGGLRSYLGNQSTMNIVYDLSGWALITGQASGTPLLRGDVRKYRYDETTQTLITELVPNAALAVTFNAGKGSVVFTTFHNRANPSMAKAIEYFALKPKEATETKDVVDVFNLDPDEVQSTASNTLSAAKEEGISVSGASQETAGTYVFAVTGTILNPQTTSLCTPNMKALRGAAEDELTEEEGEALAAASIASCNVSLLKPDGSVYKTVDMTDSAIAIDVPARDGAEGDWTFKVNSYGGYLDDNAMVVAAFVPNAAADNGDESDPGDEGSSGDGDGPAGEGGGCSAGSFGSIALLALSAAVLAKKR